MMSESQPLNAAALLALLAPTKKLAQVLAGSGASLNETPLGSLGMPPGLSPHCSRETSGAQAETEGGSHHVVPLSA